MVWIGAGSEPMTATNIHVVPSRDQWVVEQDGRPLSSHSTQAEAELFARHEAIRIRAELIVYGSDGHIVRKSSYGRGRDERDVQGWSPRATLAWVCLNRETRSVAARTTNLP